jgi:hypothetical protein
MPARSRVRSSGSSIGSAMATWSTSAPSRDYIPYMGHCDDQSGQHDASFSVRHRETFGGTVSFHYVPDPSKPGEYAEAKGFPLTAFDSPPALSHLTVSNRPSDSFLAVKLLAATNPSKPFVSVAQTIGELRELPSTLKDAGDTIMKKFAGRNLQREFGMIPIMSDALKMLHVSSEVAKRVKLFQKLRDKPQIRKANLFQGSETTMPGNIKTTNSSPIYINSKHQLVQKTTTVKIWGYVTWTGGHDFTPTNLAYADPALEYLARRAVVGSSPDLSTAWELMPWSWLADWFGNIGDYLESKRSVVPVNPGVPRICTTVTTTELWVATSTNFGFPPGSLPVTLRETSKARKLQSAALPSAFLPLLTQRQVGILASLAILRS